MRKRILKVVATSLAIFVAIDGWARQLFDFSLVDALLKALGYSAGISGIPKWITDRAAIAVLILIIKYDAIFDYSFRKEGKRKYQ